MKRIALIAVAASLMIPLMGGVCIGKGVDPPGYTVGDQWVYRLQSYNVEYLLTYTCSGDDVAEGKNCWVFDVTYNPPNYMGVFSTMTVWCEKQRGPLSASAVRVQFWGSYQGLPCVFCIVNSSEFSQGRPFPMGVGGSFKVHTTSKSTQTRLGETTTGQQKNEATYRVEGKEVINTPAGKFDCFRIVQYPQNSQKPLLIEWYSPELKNVVKVMNAMTGEVQLLRSYSLKQGGER